MSAVLRPSSMARAIEPTMIRSLRAKMGSSTIDFGLGQTDLEVTQAVARHLRRSMSASIYAPYTPNAGLFRARQAVADHVGCDPKEVMLTCGVQQGLAVSLLGLCESGDEVLVPDPGFPAYINLVRAAGATSIRYPLRSPTREEPGWGLEPQELLSRVTNRTRLVLFNNPSNPTGSVHDAEDLGEVIEELGRREVGWISDEIYEDYVWEGEFSSARSFDDRGVVLSGLSKSHHMMGWRLGWMVAPRETIAALTPLHQHLVTCAPRPAQEAAIAALESHREAMKGTREIFTERRRQVLQALKSVPVGSAPVAQGAFYLFVDARPWMDTFSTTVALAEKLLEEEDVLVIPGEGFGPAGLGHLRIAYTIGGESLDIGLRRLCGFLKRHANHGE